MAMKNTSASMISGNAAKVRERYITALAAGKTIEEATTHANGNQTPARKLEPLPPPPASLAGKVEAVLRADSPKDDIAAVCEEYLLAVGKNPFPGWNLETLRAKIKAAAEK